MLALYFVILNEVKNLLRADQRQPAHYTLSFWTKWRISSEPTSDNPHWQRIASEEILRCTQDDIERDCHGLFQASQWRWIVCGQRGDASTSLSMTHHSATPREIATSLTALAMTKTLSFWTKWRISSKPTSDNPRWQRIASEEMLRVAQHDIEPAVTKCDAASDKVWGSAIIFAPCALIFHFFCLYLREFIACVRYKYVRMRAQ